MEHPLLEKPARNPQGTAAHLRAAHVGLRTTDYEGTIQWYTEKLGLRVLNKWTMADLQLALLALPNDESFCLEVLCGGITGSAQDPSQPISSGFQHLCFEVDNADETLAALRAQGVQLVRAPFDVPEISRRCGFVADLHGNVLEFASPI